MILNLNVDKLMIRQFYEILSFITLSVYGYPNVVRFDEQNLSSHVSL